MLLAKRSATGHHANLDLSRWAAQRLQRGETGVERNTIRPP
ncbi:MAG: hypothetical protein Q8L49_09745 [Burkholderiaceae bacterium]|nr:hypothetical protein [Burkholderiaceae bacterium]